MALLNKHKEVAVVAEAPGVSLAEAQREFDAKDAEVSRLSQIVATGEVRVTTMQPVVRARFLGLGMAAEQITVEEPVTEVRQVSAPERARARRELKEAEDARQLAHEALEEAKVAAAVTTRARQQATVEAGMAVARRELPGLIKELKVAQAHMQAYAATMREFDATLDRPRFAESGWAALLDGAPLCAGSALDYWIAYVTATYLDR